MMDTNSQTRHERRRQRTRQQLQMALVAMILEKGYEGLTIQDITDRADLARATFYLHAKDKDELLWSLISDLIHATEQALARDWIGELPPQLEYYGYRNIFTHVQQNADTYRVILSNRGSPEMAHRVHDYMVGETLKDMQTLKVYTDLGLPPPITAQVVVGALLSLAIWWLETPNEFTVRQMAGMLYRALHHRDPPETG